MRAILIDESCKQMSDVNSLVQNDGTSTTSPCEESVYDCPSEGVIGLIMKNCALVKKKKTPSSKVDELACKILGTC